MKLKDPFVKKEAPIRKASIFYNTVKCLITCGLNTIEYVLCSMHCMHYEFVIFNKMNYIIAANQICCISFLLNALIFYESISSTK